MNTGNPYSPPSSPVDKDAETTAITYCAASKWRRFGTFVIDYIGFMILSFLIGIVLTLVFGEEASAIFDSVPNIVFGCVIMLTYYVFFEGLWSRTPGKWICGTRVVAESGGAPSIGQVVLRTLCRFIPFEAFSCLGTYAWHDSIPKTRVVQVTKASIRDHVGAGAK